MVKVTKAPIAKATQAAHKVAEVKPAKVERVMQNGVGQPKAGSICRAIWDNLDALFAADGGVPQPFQMRELAVKNGWNVTTAQVQSLMWRRFHNVQDLYVESPNTPKVAKVRTLRKAAAPADPTIE